MIDEEIEHADGLVVLLRATGEGNEDADFTIPSTNQNIVRVNGECEVDWVIENTFAESKQERHQRMWYVQDRFLSHNSTGNYEFDPNRGSIVGSWSKDRFPIGNTTVKVDSEVWRVVEWNDTIFISTRGEGSSLYAFELDGTERWRSDADERRGYFYVEDGKIWERTTQNRTTDHLYRFDQETGERLELVEEIDTGYW